MKLTTIAALALLAMGLTARAGAQEAAPEVFTLEPQMAFLGVPLSFGSAQEGGAHIRLWSDDHTIGVQNLTTYMRSRRNFAWYSGGGHAPGALDPGPGGTEAMRLSGGDLSVAGKVEARMGTVPKGAILMWSGPVNTIPPGWRLADGAPGVANRTVNGVLIPDLSGRFVVGYGAAAGEYSRIGATGGQPTSVVASHSHSLGSAKKVPGDHTHVTTSWGDHRSTKSGANVPVVTGHGNAAVAAPLAAQTLDNRPPYFVLAYIIYVGA